MLGRGLQERRRVRGDTDDLDVVVRIEECSHALADEHVVLSQHDADAHPTLSDPSGLACTIRA